MYLIALDSGSCSCAWRFYKDSDGVYYQFESEAEAHGFMEGKELEYEVVEI